MTIGINLSGAEFGGTGTRYGYDYHYPSASELAYYAERGVELIRLPFKWERMQTTLGGPLDAAELSRLMTFLDNAHAAGVQVIIDLHNYGRYAGQVLGSAAVTNAQFADFWKKLAAAVKDKPAVAGYDLMNEPHDMGGLDVRPKAAQAAINAIRSVDMETAIYVEGNSWSNATNWAKNNPYILMNDPANNVIYEAHLYFDYNYSGTYTKSYADDGAYPMIGVDRLQPFIDWLKANNVKGFIGEFGVPTSDPNWLVVLQNTLELMEANGLGGTAWGGGFWWSDTYKLRLGGGSSGDSAALDLLEIYFGDETGTPAPAPAPTINGTSAADVLNGTTGLDSIAAGAGNDTVTGSLGGDAIDGGSGTDKVDYSASNSGIDVDLLRVFQIGGLADQDSLVGIENVSGSGYADVIKGDGAANLLYGNGGNDLLSGRGGADRLDGGSGTDTASYADSQTAVDVSLSRTSQTGGDAQGDTLTSIENIAGSAFNDRLQGNAGANRLGGNGGDDLLEGKGGADVLEGGAGSDTASYAGSTSGVVVDLQRAVQSGGDAAGDVLKDIEKLIGSAYKDQLLGNGLANTLSGGGSADILNGRGGADVLTGGAGRDRFLFDSAANANGDRITDFARGDVLDLSPIDANALASGNQAFSYIGSKAFTGVAGQLRVVSANGSTVVSGDLNGDRLADFEIAMLGQPALSSSAFML